jgi:phosphohistidine phosphatase
LIDEFKHLSLPYEVVGGGRISHSSAEKTIRVYGVSNGFPWENGVSKHPISAELLKSEYPGYELLVEDS